LPVAAAQAAESIPTDLAEAVVSPAVHADEARIHALFSELRRTSPVHWTQPADYRPFWALTRHADIMEVSRKNDIFINSRRLNLMTRAQEATAKRAAGKSGGKYDRMYRTVAHMDNPDHREYRRVTAEWFMGPGVRKFEAAVAALAEESLDHIASFGGEPFDFATEVANLFPLRVIMSILGVPREDQPLMLRLTQQFFGADDADLGGAGAHDGANTGQHFDLLGQFFDYFTAMAADRRKAPRDDLATVIACGRPYDGPMGDLETASYYAVIATAGHDTTAAATAGGLLALLENPDQWQKLRSDPEKTRSAVEETLRWVSPVKHFLRTAREDYRLGDTTIAAGDGVALFYPSANRDDAVFADPFRFDIERSPNKHLAFGFGGHMCLGLSLARLELTTFLRAFARRVDSIEPAGDVQRIHANLVGGFKALPVRLNLVN
jgi:cytochrome P450